MTRYPRFMGLLCARLIMRGDEVALLVPSGRRVHTECVISVLRKEDP